MIKLKMMAGGLLAAFAVVAIGATGAGRAAAASTTPRTAANAPGVGDTIRLDGDQDGERLAVTLTKVIDPAHENDGLDIAPSGERLVATQFRIENLGPAAYDDSPDNSVQLIDKQGQSYQPGIEAVRGGQLFPGDVRIAAGDSRLGLVVFEVPHKAVVASVQFVPDSGFASATGTWTVSAGSSNDRPRDVVAAYYDAINNRDYATAWSLGGKNLGGTYDQFVAGFADTAHDDVTIDTANGAVVHIRLEATQNDGSIRSYQGTYTVRDGVIVSAHVVRR